METYLKARFAYIALDPDDEDNHDKAAFDAEQRKIDRAAKEKRNAELKRVAEAKKATSAAAKSVRDVEAAAKAQAKEARAQARAEKKTNGGRRREAKAVAPAQEPAMAKEGAAAQEPALAKEGAAAQEPALAKEGVALQEPALARDEVVDDVGPSSDESDSDESDGQMPAPPSASMGRRGGAKLFAGEMKPCMCGKKVCRQGSFEADTMTLCRQCKFYFLNTACAARSWYCGYCAANRIYG